MKKRWIALLIVAAGIILCLFAYIRVDIPVAFYCHDLNRSVIDVAEMITKAGESQWYFMLLVPLFLIFRLVLKNKNRAMKILFLIIAVSASGLVSTLFKWIAGRSRPIELFSHKAFGFNFFEVGYELNSFPSGHAVTVFSLAAALTVLFPRFGWLTFIPAAAIALSRVVLTSHYVSDVIAGALVGTLATLVVRYFFDRFGIKLVTGRSGDLQ